MIRKILIALGLVKAPKVWGTCHSCFWADRDNNMLFCVVNPPVIQRQDGASCYPAVRSTWRCSKWEPK